MATLAELEQRLEQIEKEVAALKGQPSSAVKNSSWLDKFIGSVTDKETFDKILEYGRAYREADRPGDDDGGDA